VKLVLKYSVLTCSMSCSNNSRQRINNNRGITNVVLCGLFYALFASDVFLLLFFQSFRYSLKNLYSRFASCERPGYKLVTMTFSFHLYYVNWTPVFPGDKMIDYHLISYKMHGWINQPRISVFNMRHWDWWMNEILYTMPSVSIMAIG